MLQVVIINGPGGFGKDEFILRVQEYCLGKAHVYNISTVDTVKEIAEKYFGVSPQVKTDAARNLWSDLKDAWVKYNDGPSRQMIKECQKFARTHGDAAQVVFIHCREPEEIEKILCGVNPFARTHTLLILRKDHPVPQCPKDFPGNMVTQQYDRIIMNDTRKGLQESAIKYTQEVLNIV